MPNLVAFKCRQIPQGDGHWTLHFLDPLDNFIHAQALDACDQVPQLEII